MSAHTRELWEPWDGGGNVSSSQRGEMVAEDLPLCGPFCGGIRTQGREGNGATDGIFSRDGVLFGVH